VKLATLHYLVPRLKTRVAIPPTLQYVFMAWGLVKHEDNFTFTCHFIGWPRGHGKHAHSSP